MALSRFLVIEALPLYPPSKALTDQAKRAADSRALVEPAACIFASCYLGQATPDVAKQHLARTISIPKGEFGCDSGQRPFG